MKKHLFVIALSLAAALVSGCYFRAPLPEPETEPEKEETQATAPAEDHEPLVPSVHDMLPTGDKAAFAKAAQTAVKSMEGVVWEPKAVEALLERATFAADADEKLKCEALLERCGVFLYDYIEDDRIITSGGSGDNFYFCVPVVAYNALDNKWILTCGGSWQNDNWNTEFFGGKLGGPDQFGLVLNERASESEGPPSAEKAESKLPYLSWESKYCRMTDKSGELAVEDSAVFKNSADSMIITVPESATDAVACEFSLQDEKRGNGFIGYRWYGRVTYSSNFSKVNFNATPYYFHDDNTGGAVNYAYAGFDKKI